MHGARRNLTLAAAALMAVHVWLGVPAGAQEPSSSAQVPALAESVLAEETAQPGAMAPAIVLPETRLPRKPRWYFEADALALRREAPKDQTMAVFTQRVWTEVENPKYDEDTDPVTEKYIWTSSDSSTTVLSLNDTRFARFQGGIDVLLGRMLGDDRALEVAYFDVADWTGTAVVRDSTTFVAEVGEYTGVPTTTYPASLFSPFTNFGNPAIVGLDYNNLACVSYTSSLNSLEMNYRQWVLDVPGCVQASMFVGGRYMNVGETFYYHTESAVPVSTGATNTVTTDTSNTMLGVQIGGAYGFSLVPDWWLDCSVKGTVFSNHATQDTSYVHNGVAAYQGTHLGSAERNGIASAIEARFTAKYAISPRMTIRGGYHLLYVNGLALAADNFSQDLDVLTSGPATVAANGDVLYHGLHFGLSCVW